MARKKALITGSHGFVGSHLKDYLLTQGIEVNYFKREWFIDPLIDEIIKNIAPDYIFHLAACGNLPGHKTDDADIFISNVGYLFNLLEAVKNIPLEGFINVSTSSVLLPYQITYAATKLGAEALCKAYADQYNIPIVTMRPFSLYGPGDHDGHVIPTIFRSCLENEPIKIAKEPMHDWTYVGDFVASMYHYAKEAHEQKGEIIHVGSGHSTSNWWLLQEIERVTNKRAHVTGEYPSRSYDTDDWVAKSSLGNVVFTPTSLADGLQKVYLSYKLN